MFGKIFIGSPEKTVIYIFCNNSDFLRAYFIPPSQGETPDEHISVCRADRFKIKLY